MMAKESEDPLNISQKSGKIMQAAGPAKRPQSRPSDKSKNVRVPSSSHSANNMTHNSNTAQNLNNKDQEAKPIDDSDDSDGYESIHDEDEDEM